jgi:hypothetical protein
MLKLLLNRFNAGRAAGALVLASVFLPWLAEATAPQLQDIQPTGAQRGTELEVTFLGERLQDAEEVICHEAGIEILKLNLVTNKQVKAQLKIAGDCRLGEHHLRVRTRTGLSELRTFLVGPFPVADEVEPNNEPAKAQKISLNTTVAGVIQNEDVDCFSVDLKKGQRFSAEVEGMRMGRGVFDPRLAVFDPDGAVVADVDDTWYGRQDPVITFLVPKDGAYVVKLREATYGGAGNCYYRLHVGSFPRPTAVYPLGGKAGETNLLTFLDAFGSELTNQVKLPESPQEMFGVFPEFEQQVAPAPNWISVSDAVNLLAQVPSQDREHAPAADQPPPLAFNGILKQRGQEDWFRFPAPKGVPLTVTVYARRLRSPLDSAIDIYDAQGQSLGSNDDSAGADSSLRFTPSAATNYFVRIRDTLGHGGRDFVYRVEVTPDVPAITVNIPAVARNDTQSRQYITVPRGNRFATLISARRANLTGEIEFGIKDLLPGVTMLTNRLASNQDLMPLVFEATADAPLGCKLVDLVATGTNGTNQVTGKFRQNVDLVEGPNNTSFFGTSVDKLCVAVTAEAPYRLRIADPKVPLVQSGSMPLEIIAERAAGFEEPIEVQMIWNPPGVSSQPELSIPKGATNVIYTLNANGGAETKTWRIAVLGHATVEGGQVFASSALSGLEIATPFISGKIETLWVNPGKTRKLTVNLQHPKPFEGKATIRLAGLPDKVTAAPREITKEDPEVVFDVVVDSACPTGSHKNLFCVVEPTDKGIVIPHVIAQGGILRVVPPKKTEPTVAANEKK